MNNAHIHARDGNALRPCDKRDSQNMSTVANARACEATPYFKKSSSLCWASLNVANFLPREYIRKSVPVITDHGDVAYFRRSLRKIINCCYFLFVFVCF